MNETTYSRIRIKELEAGNAKLKAIIAQHGENFTRLARESLDQIAELEERMKVTQCAFCGIKSVEATDTALEKIREHVEVCSEHPLAQARTRIAELEEELRKQGDRLGRTAATKLDMIEFTDKLVAQKEKRIKELEANLEKQAESIDDLRGRLERADRHRKVSQYYEQQEPEDEG